MNDRSTDTGTIAVRGDKMLLQMKPPDARTVLKTGDSLFVYTPGLNASRSTTYGKNRAFVDRFMLLGFGTKGKELKEGYQVSLVGEPTSEAKKTVELELIPKSQEIVRLVSRRSKSGTTRRHGSLYDAQASMRQGLETIPSFVIQTW